MWAQELQNVGTWTTECGYMDYRMLAQDLQNVGTGATEYGQLIYNISYIERIC